MCSPPGSPGRCNWMDTLPSEHTGGIFRPTPAIRKYSKHRDERCSKFNSDLFLVKWSRIQRINLLPLDKIYFRSAIKAVLV